MKTASDQRTSTLFRLGATLSCVLIGAGCSREWNVEHVLMGTSTDECVEDGHPTAASQPGALSLDFGDRSLWIFGETLLEQAGGDGERAIANTAAWVSTPGWVCGGSFQYLTNARGELMQLIPFSTAEQAFNDTSRVGKLRLWPTGGVVIDDVGYVYYDKVLMRGPLDVEPIGTGLATVDENGEVERQLPALRPGDPSLLWRAPLYGWGTSAVHHEDGFVYVYRASRAGQFRWETRVARVPAPSVTDPTQYRYWTGWEWTDDETLAEFVFTGASEVSVTFNTFDGRFFAIYGETLTNDVVLRTAETPWGPWSVPLGLFTGEAPQHFTIRHVRQHVGREQRSDREILVSYYSEPFAGAAGLHLVNFDLGEIE